MAWLPDGEKLWRYVYSFWHNPRMWRTDTQTDRHTHRHRMTANAAQQQKQLSFSSIFALEIFRELSVCFDPAHLHSAGHAPFLLQTTPTTTCATLLQKQCIEFVINAKPACRYAPKNKNSIKFRIWKVVVSTTFEYFIMVLIALNTLLLMMKVNTEWPKNEAALSQWRHRSKNKTKNK